MDRKGRRCQRSSDAHRLHAYVARSKRRARAGYRQARTLIAGRSHGRCEVACAPHCTGRAEHAHHVIPRGRGGHDGAENLVAVCAPCHAWIHSFPREARESGWLKSSPPRDAA